MSGGRSCRLEAIQIGRHEADATKAVLLAIGLHQLDAGNLGNRIPLVRRLERPGEQTLFLHRLRRVLGVDTRRPEKRELGDTVLVRAHDDVRLDL